MIDNTFPNRLIAALESLAVFVVIGGVLYLAGAPKLFIPFIAFFGGWPIMLKVVIPLDRRVRERLADGAKDGANRP